MADKGTSIPNTTTDASALATTPATNTANNTDVATITNIAESADSANGAEGTEGTEGAEENVDFSALMASNIPTQKNKSPFTPASKEETAKAADSARLMDGTLMSQGHTVIKGIDDNSPRKATFEHTTKVHHKISDAERDVVAQIYALNKTKRTKDKKSAPAKAKNPPSTTITTTTSTTANNNTVATTSNIGAANQQSIATGHTTIIGAVPSNDDDNVSASGAVNAFNRLRSTLNADQQAYNAMQKQPVATTVATPVAVAAPTTAMVSQPTVATAPNAALAAPAAPATPVAPEISTIPTAQMAPVAPPPAQTTQSRPQPQFATNTAAPSPYSQNFSGSEIGSAIDNNEVISGVGLGNALDDSSLNRNMLAANNQQAVATAANTIAPAATATAAPTTTRENRSLSSADFAGYPAMDPNDLPAHARRSLRPEPRPAPAAATFQTYDNDDDLPAINVDRPARTFPTAEEAPHYVVGNNRATRERSSEPAMAEHAIARAATVGMAAAASTDDKDRKSVV